MHQSWTIVLAAAIACPLMGQESPLISEAKRAWNRTANLVVAAAEKMPDEHYGYRPAPESQSFGTLVAHASNAAMGVCSGVGGERKRAGANADSSKADLANALSAAMKECGSVYGGLTEDNAGDMIPGRRGNASRLGTLYRNIIHIEHVYAQMAVHMRLNGLVPPSSEGR